MAGRISFSQVQLRSPLKADSTPNVLTDAHLGGSSALASRALVAIEGDGDTRLERNEAGHVLASFRSYLGHIGKSARLNGTDDPVTIEAHGWSNNSRMGALDLDKHMLYSPSTGFGLAGTGRPLDTSNSLTWSLNDQAGIAQKLDAVSFTVSTGLLRLPTKLSLDFDGDAAESGTYAHMKPAAKDAALNLNLRGGDKISIDFEAEQLTINGRAQTGAAVDAFFEAYVASGKNALTIGGLGVLGPKIKDLVLDRSDAPAPAPVNQAPDITLQAALTALPEDADMSQPVKVADILVGDDGIGTNVLALSGADADLFEIVGTALYLKAGVALDHGTNPQLDVSVTIDDSALGAPGSVEAVASLSIAIGDVVENQAPSVTLTQSVAALPENADTRTQIKVADIAISDDGVGANVVQLSGADADLFVVEGSELFLRAGAVLDHEARADLQLTVTVQDPELGEGPDASATLSLAIGDIRQDWGAVTLDGSVAEWAPSTALAMNGAFVLHAGLQDGNVVLALSSSGAPISTGTTFWLNTDLDRATGYQVFGWAVGAEFNVNFGADGAPALYTGGNGEVFVTTLDYVFNADRTVVEIALPGNLVGNPSQIELYSDVNDSVFLPGDYSLGGLTFGLNGAPTISLAQAISALPENADTTQRIKVADIAIADDGIGTNALRLSGADDALFEIDGWELYLRAGAPLDFEATPQLQVIVEVDDPALGDGPENSVALSLAVGDVAESWGAIALDGSTAEWSADSILTTRSEGGATYTLRGTHDADAFLVAIESDGATIGSDTTLWLNTDLDALTGYREFGTGPGAEFHIDFDANGTPALYSGTNRETFVSTLDFKFNADRSAVEIALPGDLVGGATRLELYGDINNAVFVPNPYGTGYTFGAPPPTLPVDPTERVAIVYSETSANAYFDKTAYGQLFMAAQHQAMQAGIPFDVISETDLSDLSRLASYDAIVFPGLSHVPAALLDGIAETLTSASRDYGVGLIAMGNFLTNDETGAAFAGDSYARMKSILGVTLDGFGATSGVDLRAAGGVHPVSDLYGANESVGTYTNNSYLAFADTTGSGQTLFDQITDDGMRPAVIATTTGGRNVHFATDAAFGNNNILHEAIRWSSHGDQPDIALKMTRGESLFFSRNDMDQSQELYDVVDKTPGIYDEMIPILEQWYNDFGFVGSYYVNVGANPDEFQATDWSVSRPYYERIMALESEIGTHSYTHPHDTNLLLPDIVTDEVRAQKIVPNGELQPLVAGLSLAQINQELAAALVATDPSGANPVARSTLSAVQQALLEFSLRFQFQYSREVIERELGLENLGAAVPGAPEKIDASHGMMQYLEYLTGGYSGVGAGYPGAFGFLDPDHTDKVYFAPNVSFDFSLIEFQGLSAAQAQARWAAEFAQITDKGSTPIIHFPWHDYGPTDWAATDGASAGYTTEMFTNFIRQAHQAGTEFVTGADLAGRIESFTASDISVEQTDGGLRVAVTGADLGSFSIKAGSTIANVGGWYAYDGDRVLMDANGGAFDVTFGAQSDDVTRLVSLPMRADLVSVSGDGSDLAFAFDGLGTFGIALQTLGDRSVVVDGARDGTLAGDLLSLRTDGSGRHTVAVEYRGGEEVLGDGGANVIVVSDSGRRMDGGGGADTLILGSGADTFVFDVGSGADHVLNFDTGNDRIDLSGFGLADFETAMQNFSSTDTGAKFSFAADEFVLANVSFDALAADNLVLSEAALV